MKFFVHRICLYKCFLHAVELHTAVDIDNQAYRILYVVFKPAELVILLRLYS